MKQTVEAWQFSRVIVVASDNSHKILALAESSKNPTYSSMRLCLGILAILLAHSLTLAADYPAASGCSPQSLVNSGFRKNLTDIAYSLESEQAPFNFACQNANATVGRPKTSLFNRDVPLKDQKSYRSVDFLKQIESKIRSKIQDNKNMAKAVKTCLKQDSAKCAEIKDWTTNALPDFVGTARFHLSLAQSAHQIKTWFGKTSTNINTDLDSLGSPKLKHWDPLSAQEKAQAQKAMKIYQEQIRKEHKDSTAEEKKEALLVLRYQHFEQYQSMMAQLPFLQYIQTAKPTPKDILNAVTELETNIATEEAELNKITKALAQNPLGTKSLDLLRYATLVEETLLEKPQYCAIATSLVFTSDNRELGNALAIGLPLLAVSIFAPPIAASMGASALTASGVGVGIGATAGAAFIYDSQKILDQERTRSFSQFYGDESGLELEQVRVAESMRDFQVITMPLALTGTGALAKTALVKRGAIKMASQIPLAMKKP
ncbi:AAA family ATPase [Bdellovibrio svalbardensis]|uniref:Uncharacterized protein n=1 Tax=Bdellovibrio svalbardensis TaxID=2972972 RepID=A0ABT6DIX9_9BACT|nr:hypothetical protein [Bdellovibrio svalbardensis]MDG0816748.1 hypothetical protein [Bdellovibrio svalbardensis]